VQGGKKSGVPMPSTVKRRLERLKRRREDRARLRATAAAASSTADSGDGAAGDGLEDGGPRDDADGLGNADDEGAANGRAAKRAAVTAAVEAAAAAAAAAGIGGDAGEAGAGSQRAPGNADEAADGSGSETQEQCQAQPTVVAPKVTIDEDGNIVIDKESLVVSAAAAPATELDNARLVTVDNNAITKHITSATFARRDTAQKWEVEDDEKFFHALSRFGTDFSLIEHVFPTRTRRQIKLKFKREERKNRTKVDACLRTRGSINITDTRKQFGLTGEAHVRLASGTSPGEATPDAAERTVADAIVATAEQTFVTPPMENETNVAGPGEGTILGAPPKPTHILADDSSSDDDDDDDDDGNERGGRLAGATTSDIDAGATSGSFGLAGGLGDHGSDLRHESHTGLAEASAAHLPAVVAEGGDDMDDVLAHQQY
jgi:hypothetical protein